jgi:hypothetical protein
MVYPLVLHTCDSYEKWWPIWFFFYKKYISGYTKVYFLTEEKDPPFSSPELQVIKTGKGAWGERLIKALKLISEDFIYYCQEDYWAEIPFHPESYELLFHTFTMDALRITEKIDNMGFSFTPISSNLYRYKNDSAYLMNHRFSLWNKHFFLRFIASHESPWDNEHTMTEALRRIDHRIYHYSSKWYDAQITRGVLRKDGHTLLKKHKEELLAFYLACCPLSKPPNF